LESDDVGVKIFKPPTKTKTAINGIISRHCSINRALHIGRKKREYQSLIAFDLTCLPCLMTILQSTLSVYLYENCLPQQEKTITVHQIVSPWQKGKAALIRPNPVASASVGAINNVFINFDITSLVLDWHNGNAVNFGVLLKLESKTSCLPNVLACCSKHVSNSQCWPRLEVSFLEPAPSEGCCQIIDCDSSVLTSDIINTTAILNIQQFNYTYFIINNGINSALVSLQVSPDGLNWITETSQVITPGVMLPFVPNVIAKYARLTYQSSIPNHCTFLDIRVRGFSS
jgi:hypothetical protein